MVPSLEPDVYYGFMCPRTKKKKKPHPHCSSHKRLRVPFGEYTWACQATAHIATQFVSLH